MATRNYTIQFDADTSGLVGNVRRLIELLNGLNTAARQAQGGISALSDQDKESVKSSDELAGAFSRLGIQALALNEIRKAVGAIGEANKEAWEYAEKLATEHANLVASLRELASLKGKAAPTETDVKQVAMTQLVSGMTSKEATAFETSWANTIQPAIDSGAFATFKPGQLEQTKQQLALFAKRKKIAPDKLAEMALGATIGSPVKTPEEFYARVQGISEMADVGLGHATDLFEAFKSERSMVRPQGGGAFRSSEEMGAATSVSSLFHSPQVAATMTFQAWRQLQYPQFAKQYGAQGKDFVARVAIVKQILEEGRAQGKDDMTTLSEAHIGDSRARRSLIEFANNFDLLEKWTGRMGRGRSSDQFARDVADRAKKLTGDNQEYLKSETGQRALAGAEREVYETGVVGAQEEPASTAFMRAETRLMAEGEIGGTRSFLDMLNDQINPLGHLSGTDARSRRIRRDAAMRLLREAQAARIPDLGKFVPQYALEKVPAGVKIAGPTGAESWAEEMSLRPDRFAATVRALYPKITAAGGSPYGSTDAVRGALDRTIPTAGGSDQPKVQIESNDIQQAAEKMQAAGQMMLHAAQQSGGQPPLDYSYKAARK